jgi:DNA-directed RNA polymerase subunit alpha
MHIIQEEIGLPNLTEVVLGDHHSVFTFSPLPQGFGTTIGNALRRTLLSSLPGAAVTGVKIKGVSHEYMVVKGSKDSVLDMMLNLKQLAVSMESSTPVMLKLKTTKAGEITAKDIDVPGGVTIHNPEMYITTLDKSSSLDMEIRIEKGVGFRPTVIGETQDAEMLDIDAVFSPLKRVHYDVEATRVGQRVDLDKLELEIKTRGSLTPREALFFSAGVLESYFGLFNADKVSVEPSFRTDADSLSKKAGPEGPAAVGTSNYTPIEILGLSPRTLNALINGNIGSIEELIQCNPSRLANLRGFGKKALTEVDEALEKRGFKLLIEE